MLSCKPFASGAIALRQNRGRVACHVVASGDNGAFAVGSKVKVVKEVKVYHAGPQYSDGLDLNGMEGVITKNVVYYQHKDTLKQLSANLPYQVQFQVEKNGKPAKLLCHLVSSSCHSCMHASAHAAILVTYCTVLCLPYAMCADQRWGAYLTQLAALTVKCLFLLLD